MATPTGTEERREAAPPRWRSLLRNERLIFGTLGFVGLLAAWEAVSRLGVVKRSLISAPSLIFTTGVAEFSSGVIWDHIATSLMEWAVGFGIALIIAIPLGLVIGWFRRVDGLTSLLLPAAYSTPMVALVPLIILVAGIGLVEKIIVVVLLTVFAVIVNTASGVAAVDRRYHDIARSYKASQWLTFRAVVLPSTIPFIITGIRIGAGRALVGVVVGELLASNKGVGFYISFWGAVADTNRVMLGILILGVFGITIGEVIRTVEHRFDVWRPALR